MMRLLLTIVCAAMLYGCGNSKAEVNETPVEEVVPLKTRLGQRMYQYMNKDAATVESATLAEAQTLLLSITSDRVLINSGLNDPQATSAAKDLKPYVVKKMKKAYPLMRKAYAEELANKMWEHDVYVTTTGKDNSILNITAAIFAANKNKKEFQERIQQGLADYRFKEVRYRWYKGQDEFTYWKPYTGKDEDI